MNFIIIVLYIVIIFLLYLVYRYLIVFSHALVTNLYLKSGHPNIPLNKWIQVMIRVEDNTMDIYINGSLAKRHIFTSVPRQNNGDVFVAQNGGFTGYLSNLRYYAYGLQPGEIVDIVKQGPNLKAAKQSNSPLNAKPPYLSLQWYTQNV